MRGNGDSVAIAPWSVAVEKLIVDVERRTIAKETYDTYTANSKQSEHKKSPYIYKYVRIMRALTANYLFLLDFAAELECAASVTSTV